MWSLMEWITCQKKLVISVSEWKAPRVTSDEWLVITITVLFSLTIWGMPNPIIKCFACMVFRCPFLFFCIIYCRRTASVFRVHKQQHNLKGHQTHQNTTKEKEKIWIFFCIKRASNPPKSYNLSSPFFTRWTNEKTVYMVCVGKEWQRILISSFLFTHKNNK